MSVSATSTEAVKNNHSDDLEKKWKDVLQFSMCQTIVMSCDVEPVTRYYDALTATLVDGISTIVHLGKYFEQRRWDCNYVYPYMVMAKVLRPDLFLDPLCCAEETLHLVYEFTPAYLFNKPKNTVKLKQVRELTRKFNLLQFEAKENEIFTDLQHSLSQIMTKKKSFRYNRDLLEPIRFANQFFHSLKHIKKVYTRSEFLNNFAQKPKKTEGYYHNVINISLPSSYSFLDHVQSKIEQQPDRQLNFESKTFGDIHYYPPKSGVVYEEVPSALLYVYHT